MPSPSVARVAAPWSTRVTTVPDASATPTGLLLRPDGVVAWATDVPDPVGLAPVLHDWAGAPSPEHAPVG
ncbi:hypothetical protein QRX50_15555 [Amycolatopsis carbonis]|uniref:Uncharacterized protein n=1 Tax=Amycolatopsis carbonis TaxID=715471 RepID=A0A9Y2IKK9_9PSEU|nr:hypothetical protein [Amycolatopsis sp. 2-15]WIX82070.1 hypothetical protein QRX50_15555 [Amycolatopsis sp. 2-15]